jgi:hypothetical protein
VGADIVIRSRGEYPIAVDAADLVRLRGAARFEAAGLNGWRPVRLNDQAWAQSRRVLARDKSPVAADSSAHVDVHK